MNMENCQKLNLLKLELENANFQLKELKNKIKYLKNEIRKYDSMFIQTEMDFK